MDINKFDQRVRLSRRIKSVRPSPTFALDTYVKTLQRKGQRIINLGLGEPDFNTPLNIKKSAIKAINEGFTHYTTPAGIEELRTAIADKFKKENGVFYEPSQIVVGVGSKQLLYNAFQVLCEHGDEVLIPIPTWSTYIEQVKLSGAKPIFVTLKEPYKLKAKDVLQKITVKTKILLINSPSNPTGAVIDKEELVKIAKIAQKKNIYIISDEIYEKIIYEGKHLSIASLGNGIKDLTITINGFSKAYAMTGWRLGYAGGPQYIIDAMITLQGQTTSNTSSIAQKAGVEALKGSQVEVARMINQFKRRRDYLTKKLSSFKHLSFALPTGAFYFFIDIRKILGKEYKSSEEWSMALLAEKGVAVVPGEAFEMPGHIRLSFASSMDELKKAIERIEQFLL